MSIFSGLMDTITDLIDTVNTEILGNESFKK